MPELGDKNCNSAVDSYSDVSVSEMVRLDQLTGSSTDVHAISPIAYARVSQMYEVELLRDIDRKASALSAGAMSRYLDLNMLRAAHRVIDEVAELVRSTKRLELLSEIAGVALEPYHIDVACSHINYYEPDCTAIQFHSDGSAIVELIPLSAYEESPEIGTLVYQGPRDEGLALLASSGEESILPRCRTVPHRLGESTLLQGRRVLHGGSKSNVQRRLLVIAMRSVEEPWKDDNTLSRLALDYEPREFVDDWVKDEIDVKVPALRASG